MLEHAKTHHTNYIKGKAYEVVVPPEKEKMFTMFVEKHGFTIKRGDEQSIPWRESFSEISDEKLPGKILAGARYREGITQTELSKQTGIPQRHISEMESGKRSIGKENAKKLARALNAATYRIFL